MGAQGKRSLAPPLFTTRGCYKEAITSLSLKRSVQLLITINLTHTHTHIVSKMRALSHIYTYMTFRVLTQMSTPISRTDMYRFLGQPILSIFHSEGHVS